MRDPLLEGRDAESRVWFCPLRCVSPFQRQGIAADSRWTLAMSGRAIATQAEASALGGSPASSSRRTSIAAATWAAAICNSAPSRWARTDSSRSSAIVDNSRPPERRGLIVFFRQADKLYELRQGAGETLGNRDSFNLDSIQLTKIVPWVCMSRRTLVPPPVSWRKKLNAKQSCASSPKDCPIAGHAIHRKASRHKRTICYNRALDGGIHMFLMCFRFSDTPGGDVSLWLLAFRLGLDLHCCRHRFSRRARYPRSRMA